MITGGSVRKWTHFELDFVQDAIYFLLSIYPYYTEVMMTLHISRCQCQFTPCSTVREMFALLFSLIPTEITMGDFEEEFGELVPHTLAVVLQGLSSWAPEF
jgi:hypothetical protein